VRSRVSGLQHATGWQTGTPIGRLCNWPARAHTTSTPHGRTVITQHGLPLLICHHVVSIHIPVADAPADSGRQHRGTRNGLAAGLQAVDWARAGWLGPHAG
jgi:hypothetical protein